jgi:integrase
MAKNKKILPSLKELELVRGKIKQMANKKGEYLRGVHYGCYLLCSQSGLRISEAVKFDLKAKNRRGLYRIEKPKGKKERLIYVSKEVVRELKRQNWQPHQTNR